MSDTDLSKKSVKRCTFGWSWGYYCLNDKSFEFKINNQQCFELEFDRIAMASANGKNEVAIDIVDQTKNNEKGDLLAELRLFVPNPEIQEDVGENKKDEEEKEAARTPAQVTADDILDKAGIGNFAGEMITRIPD